MFDVTQRQGQRPVWQNLLATVGLGHRQTATRRRKGRSGLAPELLETRQVLSSSLPLSDTDWTPIGPQPITNGGTPITNPDGSISQSAITGAVTSVVTSPTDPNTIFLGSPGGGIWRSSDGGQTWANMTDFITSPALAGKNPTAIVYKDFQGNELPAQYRTQVISSIAVAPSNPMVVWAGTGAENYSPDGVSGRGLLKSTDGGQNWVLVQGSRTGNADPVTGRFQNDQTFDRRGVSKIVVNPTDENIVYFTTVQINTTPEGQIRGVEGQVNGLGGNAGVWKTRDGGETWINTTAVIPPPPPQGVITSQPLSTFNDYTDLIASPSDPETLYVGVTTGRGVANGLSESGVYKTTNGGTTWFRLSDHPSGFFVGRIKLAVSRTEPNTVYSLITSGFTDNNANPPTLVNSTYLLVKTTNGGLSWTTQPNLPENLLNFEGGGFYAAAIAVDPNDADIVYAAGRELLRSADGGFSWTNISAGASTNAFLPVRTMSWDRQGPGARLLIGTDGGVFRLDGFDSVTGAPLWTNLNTSPGNGGLNITQVRDIDVNRFDPNLAYAASWHTGTNLFNDSNDWTQAIAGDGGNVVVDFSNPNNIYRSYRNQVFKSTDAGQTWSQVFTAPVVTNDGTPPLRYSPLQMDPGNSNRLLFATNIIYESVDAGRTWRVVNHIPDFTVSPPINYRIRPGNPAIDYGWDADGRIVTLGVSTNRDIVYAATLGEWINSATPPNVYPGASWFQPKIFVSNFQYGGANVDPWYYQWTDITSLFPASVQGRIPYKIRVDPQDPRTAYFVYNFYNNGNLTGKVIRVTGSDTASPQVVDITGNIAGRMLPDVPVWSVDIDPRQFGPSDDIIYVATDVGVYSALANDDINRNWQRFGLGLPYVSVRDIQIVKNTNTMTVATYGRGVWQIQPNARPTLTQVDGISPLTSNDPIDPVPTLTTNEDTSIIFRYEDIAPYSDIADRNNDALAFLLQSYDPTLGTLETLSGATFVPVTPGSTRLEPNNPGSRWRWTPAANKNNTTNNGPFDAFRVFATDLELVSANSAVVKINVNPVNDAPVINNPITMVAGPNGARIITFAEFQQAANPRDIEGDAVTYIITQVQGFPPGITVTKNGVPIAVGMTFGPGETLVVNTVGQSIGTLTPAIFTVVGVDNGTPSPAASIPSSVNVSIQNSAPTLTSVSPFPGGTEDTAYGITYAQLLAQSNASDREGDTIIFVITGMLNGATMTRNGVPVSPSAANPVIITPSDALAVQPPANANRQVSAGATGVFTVRVTDTLATSTNDVTVSIDLSPVPDRPILPNGQSNLPGASKGRPFPISYASLIAGTGGFDPDDINNVDPSTGLPLRFVIDSIISGSLIINNFPAQVGQLFGPNDSMIWNAPSAFVGSQAAFSVRLWDGNDQQTAGLYSASGTIVNVTTQNDRPTLTSVVPIGGVTEDVPFTLSFATLANAANEADINADPITFRVESILAGSLSLNGQPVAPGTVFAAGQNLVWNPPVDANGTIVAFTISAFDGELLSTPPVNVPFVVSAVNDAPRFSQGIVLPNGIIGNSYNLTYDLIRQATGAFDVDSPILTFTISTINAGELRRNGVAIGAGAVIAPTDQLVYIPPVNVPGIIGAFTINVSDGSLSSGPATVNIQNTLARFYRSYNPNAGYHFFTTSRDEFQIAVRNGLRDETTNTPGMAVFTAPASGLNAIHRLRNPNTGRHYYTASDGERDGLVTKGWIFERDEGYVGTQAVNGMSPIYRLYNSNTGTHLYVDNQGTRDSIIAQYKGIWQDHGILGYAVVVPGSTILSPVAGSGTTNPTSPTGPSERRLLPPSTASSLPPTPAALSVADQGLVATSNGISSTVSNDTGSTFTTGNAGSGSSQASTPAAPSVDQYWAELSQNLLKSHGVDLGTALLPLQ